MNAQTQNSPQAIQEIQEIAIRVMLLLLGYLTITLGLSAMPSSAWAATLVTSVSFPATAAARQQTQTQRIVSVSHRPHRYSRYSLQTQRAGMRKVMFTPARPSFGQALALHETPDALALRSSVA